ncbi:zinc finger CCCH domain-containing ZFN-like isoform X1 [Chlorella sorokiniana]|uniref:Zinc finger CCCH domain-containing ZFN-like isoform X1 n=1 Tax=Chlorella sorokiniana TaxID=3076 RepID=A0A2P6TVR5_CHLSO|nr:zinc finger CCCH domain-containing ZFN-like isoform X1 [Chlorella sorokiniana]|eukprot:PRW58157.1 zinc finger CCCH domain-containing ZFN-like isoform X1 [Chlorella sorokiniana]
MEDAQGAVEEAQRLGLLARLQQAGGPSTAEELASQLGIAERVVVGLMGRLAGHAVVEPVPLSSGDPSQPPAYRLLPPYSSGAAVAQQQQQQRRSGRRGGGGGSSMQPKVGRPGPNSSQMSPPQHGYMMAGMMPFGYGPYAQQVVYYQPAAGMGGLGPYQQPPPMPAPAGQWTPHPNSSSGTGQRRQGGGGPSPAAAMQMGPAGAGGSYPGIPGGPPQFGYYPGGPSAPHTPAVSGPHQRQSGIGRVSSSSSGGASSTGWGGVPLSQSAAEVLAGAAASPRTTPAVRTPSGSLELPAASSVTLGVAASPESGEAGPSGSSLPPAAAASASAGRPALPAQQAAEQPGEGESASPAGLSSSSSDAEEGGEQQRRASSLAASSSSGGEGGKGGRSSSGGSSGGSRRSRGSRDRGQQPCAFFLKTGTCAYGDNCKFGHPLDKAPKVQFNSLGLPLRPGEPECAFYMRNYRCAFGHTCKFHHPELPQGACMGPAFGVPSYHMAAGYPGQLGGPGPSPMMGSLLGMHAGKPGGPGGPGVPPHGPGLMAVGSPPGPSSPHFFLQPFPPGAHPMYQGRPAAMFPAMPHGMPQPNGRRDRGSSGGGGGGRAAAAASPVSTPSGAPLPVPVAAAPQGGSPTAEPAGQAGLPASEPSNGISVPAAAAAAAMAASSPPAVPAELSSSPAAPAPIMVFNRQQEASQKLVTALEQLEIAPAAPEGPAGQRSGGGGGGDGVSLPPPQQQADVLAAA